MTWNWQQPDWPRFAWNPPRLAAAEQQFLVGGGTFVGAIKHLGDEDRNQLTVEAMSTEALTTSEIKVRSSIGQVSSRPSSGSWGWQRTTGAPHRRSAASRR